MGLASYYASGTNMAYTTANSSTWTRESARQGSYSTTLYYGVMMFGFINDFDYKGKTITNIKLVMDFNQAGANGIKTLSLKRTTKTSITGTGSTMLGTAIGDISGVFYSNAQTFNFNANSNQAIFGNLIDHFSNGGTGIAVYRNEASQSSPQWSLNYTSIAAATLVFTFADDFVWYNNNGVWARCAAHYCENGIWKRCRMYYNNGGTWI